MDERALPGGGADALLTRLRERFDDRLVTAGDARFDAARAVWNGMVDRVPLAVARCGGAADVAYVVREATASGVPVSVKGGGHQIAGAAVADGAIVIDLGGLRAVDVDVVSGRVTVGGGALLGDLDWALGRHGLAVPAGVVSHTGVGGLVLGGGIGWLSRSRGLTSDHLVSARAVLGSGEIVVTDESHEPDLFWALRGGGGSFGAVVEYTMQAQPIGEVTFGTRVVPLAEARDALAAYGERAASLPRELQVMVKLQKIAGDRVGAFTGTPAVTVEWLWSGDAAAEADAERMLGLSSFGTARSRRMRFAEVQSSQDHRYPHGYRYFLKPGHLRALDADVIDVMLDAASTMPPEDAQIELLLLGGAVADVGEDDTAYPRRDAALAFNVTGGWRSAPSDQAHVDWCRRTHAALARFAPAGAYLNFVGAAAAPDLADVFGAEKLARLRRIKGRYDPADVFRSMAHITPADDTVTTTRPPRRTEQDAP
ncbi:FAD-binding oxidoreductase [Subtercola sp. YIM 133946]|uniref:FAD-binding oxidoreductase n=1 Tax=Subtercola sp. YIM 133946 TaxID=3118909 RepID=UPI002F92A5BB